MESSLVRASVIDDNNLETTTIGETNHVAMDRGQRCLDLQRLVEGGDENRDERQVIGCRELGVSNDCRHCTASFTRGVDCGAGFDGERRANVA